MNIGEHVPFGEKSFVQAIGKIEEKMYHEFKDSLDPAHDFAHFKRVVATAKKLAVEEHAKLEVVLPAAWLHDLVNLPKNDPRRSQASRLSADAGEEFLRLIEYPAEFIPAIRHAIMAHSYSANIAIESIEAAVVQDADRLDGLGAIGIARVFSVGALMKRKIHADHDILGTEGRTLNDQEFTLDHFFVKLFKTVDTLKTAAGKKEGLRRAEIMRNYLEALEEECRFS